MQEFTLQDLSGVQADLVTANRFVTELQYRRELIICELHKSGMSARALSVHLNVTEGRIHQILRAGPGAMTGTLAGFETRFVQDETGQVVRAIVLYPNDEDMAVDHVEEIDL